MSLVAVKRQLNGYPILSYLILSYPILSYQASAKLRAEKSKRQALLNEWLPPNLDSSDEDETDDELAQDVDLRK